MFREAASNAEVEENLKLIKIVDVEVNPILTLLYFLTIYRRY